LKIFSNVYAEKGSTEEEKRIDEFLSDEVSKIMQSLASGPLPNKWPDSFKEHIKRLLNMARRTTKTTTNDNIT
jgi:hypothetical protein